MEEPGYVGVLQQKPGSRNIKGLVLIKENQKKKKKEEERKKTRHLKLMNLVSFSMYGKMQESGLIEIYIYIFLMFTLTL